MLVKNVGTAQHIGERASQEDSLHAFQTPHWSVGMVSDGMGGFAGGRRASRAAKRVWLDELRGWDGGQPLPSGVHAQMETAIREAHAALNALGPDKHGKPFVGGGTMAIAALGNGVFSFAHAGDSRIVHLKRFPNGKFLAEPLNTPHNAGLTIAKEDLEYERRKRGKPAPAGLARRITYDTMYKNIFSNTLTTVLGPREKHSLLVETGQRNAQPGDVFLLATDGLSALTLNETAKAATSFYQSKPAAAPAEFATHLVELALAKAPQKRLTTRYHADNTSVIIFHA